MLAFRPRHLSNFPIEFSDQYLSLVQTIIYGARNLIQAATSNVFVRILGYK